MTTLSSTEVKEPLTPFSVKFENDSQKQKEITVVEKFISTQAQAQERAIAELLEKGYRSKTIRFSTFKHHEVGEQIDVGGDVFKIEKVTISVDKKIVYNIEGVRYEE